jgi:hypothetical protein
MFGFDVSLRSPRVGNCAQCGREVMANIQMLSDAPIVCSKCRCSVCRIVLSADVCRCGIAHGKPSVVKTVCARCYAMLEAGAFTEQSLGIVDEAVHAYEQTLEGDGMDDDFDESEETEPTIFSEETHESCSNEEFLIESDITEKSIVAL